MTDKKDIIGIVKELQVAWNELATNGWPPQATRELDEEISNNFPVIAGALLLAVDLLEKIEERACPECLSSDEASEVLNRIRQL